MVLAADGVLDVAVVAHVGAVEEQVIALVVLVEAVGELHTVAFIHVPLPAEAAAEIAVAVAGIALQVPLAEEVAGAGSEF